ncbi:MAG: hypothetical protein ACKVP0_05525 [Pirellulaceae bacterium]
MAKSAPFFRTTLSLLTIALALPAMAVEPSENLLPNTTKGFVSTPNLEQTQAQLRETELGKMFNDPLMQPFVEDLEKQIRSRLAKAGVRLGLTFEDLKGVDSGEVALAVVQPDPKDKNSHATVLIIDVTGKEAAAKAMLEKIAANQIAKKAVKSAIKAGNIDLNIFTLPLQPDEATPEHVVFCLHNDQIVLSDSQAVVTGIAGRFGAAAGDSLAKLSAFEHSMAKNAKAAGEAKPSLRWFIEPFGYVEVSRAINGGKRKRGRDLLKILAGQGFNAVQGLGGNVFFTTGTEDILHRTFVYAPPVVRKEGDKNKDKYNLAMRMLEFKNSEETAPPGWVPADAATYITFHMDLKKAFHYSESLVDEYAGDKGVFKAMWENLAHDPAGPMIDIEKELIDHLGERVTLVSDVKIPVDLKSERLIVAIELLGPKSAVIVTKTLDKAFSADPAAKKREFKGHVIWELINDAAVEPDLLTVEGAAAPGGKSGDDEEKEEEETEEKPILPNMAFTVVNGQLFVGTHVEFMEEVIGKGGTAPPMLKSNDYLRISDALARLGATKDSFRLFTRTDESYRGTYELLKQGKLPQAESMFAKLLNGILSSGEKGETRKQEIDGSKLPEFKHVQKYLGPAGSYVHSEEEGWFIVGVLLKKEAKVVK